MAWATPHTRDIQGTTMRWLETGQGMPVVFVHGFPTSPALWRHVAPRLDNLHLLMWEMVGYGESIPEAGYRDLSVSHQADMLRAWMRELDIGPAVLVGHGLGGGVVQLAAAREPRLCAGLVLCNSIGHTTWADVPARNLRGLRHVMATQPEAMFEANFELIMRQGHATEAMADASCRFHLTPYQVHGGVRALVRQVRALNRADLLDDEDILTLLRSHCPVRVVAGTDDPFVDLATAHQLARRLDATLVAVEGARHFIPEDQPGMVAEAVAATVADIMASFARISQPELPTVSRSNLPTLRPQQIPRGRKIEQPATVIVRPSML